MVAETPQPKVKPPRISTANRFSEVTRATIRRLYIVAGQSPAQIAFSLSLKPQQVRNLVSREGWLSLKSGKDATRKKQLEEKLLARAHEDQNRVVEASAVLSEDLQLRTLNKCVGILDEGGEDVEKRLQMASGAARNFVTITSELRGRNRGANQPGSGAGPSQTLIFVGALPRAERKVEHATAAAVDVSAQIVTEAPPQLPSA